MHLLNSWLENDQLRFGTLGAFPFVVPAQRSSTLNSLDASCTLFHYNTDSIKWAGLS